MASSLTYVMSWRGERDGLRYGQMAVRGRRLHFLLDKLTGKVRLWKPFTALDGQPREITDRGYLDEATECLGAWLRR